MQKTGAEWVFRLLQEPGRLAGRYGKDLRVFGFAILRQWWQMRRRKDKHHSADAASVSVDASGVSVIQAPARLDAAAVAGQGNAWRDSVIRGHVVFNLAATEFADSTGIGALIRLRKLSRDNGRAFVLASPPAALESSFRLMRLEGFFSVEPGLDAARARVQTEIFGADVSKAPQVEVCVIRWKGEATAANIDDLRAKTETEIGVLPPGARAVIDLSSLAFSDSAGIGLMVRLKRWGQRRDVTLAFRNPNETVRNVLRMTRLENFLLEGPV
jgi:anti-anti-sigma factor